MTTGLGEKTSPRRVLSPPRPLPALTSPWGGPRAQVITFPRGFGMKLVLRLGSSPVPSVKYMATSLRLSVIVLAQAM
eukprot:5940816-Pyramimonas_sp.AAC.1